jgi:hypothetical protein
MFGPVFLLLIPVGVAMLGIVKLSFLVVAAGMMILLLLVMAIAAIRRRW